MQQVEEKRESPVFGLRYLEDREVEGIDIVGCGFVAAGVDDSCPDIDKWEMN